MTDKPESQVNPVDSAIMDIVIRKAQERGYNISVEAKKEFEDVFLTCTYLLEISMNLITMVAIQTRDDHKESFTGNIKRFVDIALENGFSMRNEINSIKKLK